MINKKHDVLKDYFGFTSFRTGQEGLIDNILNGKDTLGIMPTGAGKSLCFQLPALIFDGITLVISPLISLMKDQVGSLNQNGISAAYINSSLNFTQYNKAIQNAKDGKYKIIYIAPERLEAKEFIDFSVAADISMITVDEAHCVSQWGQDFRPSYLKIPEFIGKLKTRPVIAAFTATATSYVREDIISKLGLNDPYVITTGFDRKNLFFSAQKPKNKFFVLKEYVEKNKDKCGIIYCSTRKTVDILCSNLNDLGYATVSYHAGLADEDRRKNQESFIYDKAKIMVATNAFGMGIDKSDISYIIHYNMPKNIESYYQEAGRAGRDGEPAECIILYGGKDVAINRLLIENSNGNENLDSETIEAIKEKDRELLKIMTFYCHTNDCLRKYILNYFGEQSPNYCGNCSNCKTNFEEKDITIEAQMIMSCIKRTGERFGARMIIDILRGSKNQRVVRSGFDNISTYGLMSGVPENAIRDIINYLLLQEYLVVTNDEYPIIQLKQKARDILFGNCSISMKVQKYYKDESRADKTKSKTDKSDNNIDEELFEKLRSLRSKIAKEQKMPAYIVFSDAALKDMCLRKPRSREEFLQVNGVGLVKLERYGDAFLEEIKR
jgi:ATP-dependent DNA helicase RecQ